MADVADLSLEHRVAGRRRVRLARLGLVARVAARVDGQAANAGAAAVPTLI